MAELIDLNHRHALDGSDPNSYGGLLWALGLFDRPFTPERPILGTVRGRDTAGHARRLDLDAFARRVDRPARGERLRIAVIGAGLSGLAAARTLADQDHEVIVFEKSRGYGGRAATRRIVEFSRQVDHGAQYFTARDPRFRRRVLSWAERGVVARWQGRIGAWDGNGIQAAGADDERWVGLPGMSGLGRMLAEDLTIRLETRVIAPRRDGDAWLLLDDQANELGRFDRVIIAAPAPQAAELLADAPALATEAASVRYAPCWTVMIGFDTPVELPWDGLFVNQGPLGWVANDGAKPGRGEPVSVLHANADWSRRHLELDQEAVVAALLEAFAAIVGRPLPAVAWSRAHRWLYSLGQPAGHRLSVGRRPRYRHCGDWCRRARIEGAWLSGGRWSGRLLADSERWRSVTSPHSGADSPRGADRPPPHVPRTSRGPIAMCCTSTGASRYSCSMVTYCTGKSCARCGAGRVRDSQKQSSGSLRG